MTGHYGTEDESSAFVELGQAVATVVAIVSMVQKLISLSTLLKCVLNNLLRLFV